ncbi:hypothetical protein [Stieleria marina]
MDYRRLSWSLAALICIWATFSSPSLSQETGLLDSQATNRQFNRGPAVQAVGMTTPARMLNRATDRSLPKQIRVKIHYLIVDEESRTAVYDLLSSDSVSLVTQKLPEKSLPTEFVQKGSDLQSSRTMSTTSCVATSVIDGQKRDEILTQITQSAGAKISSAPTIILLDGNEGQMDEIVQRPFVVGMPPASQENPSITSSSAVANSATPTIQVVDEGTSIRVRAISRDDTYVHLANEVISKQIIGVENTKVFGREKSAVLQRPIQQVETAVAAVEMQFGQTLLIDPYIARDVEVEIEREVPIFGKIPYVNRSFKNTAKATKTTNWLIMVQPTLDTSVVLQVSATSAMEIR